MVTVWGRIKVSDKNHIPCVCKCLGGIGAKKSCPKMNLFMAQSCIQMLLK